MASPAAAGGAAAGSSRATSTFLTLYASDLTLSLSQLTYDKRMKVEVGAMSLCDGCGLRLLRLEPISKDSGDNEEENKPRQRQAPASRSACARRETARRCWRRCTRVRSCPRTPSPSASR